MIDEGGLFQAMQATKHFSIIFPFQYSILLYDCWMMNCQHALQAILKNDHCANNAACCWIVDLNVVEYFVAQMRNSKLEFMTQSLQCNGVGKSKVSWHFCMLTAPQNAALRLSVGVQAFKMLLRRRTWRPCSSACRLILQEPGFWRSADHCSLPWVKACLCSMLCIRYLFAPLTVTTCQGQVKDLSPSRAWHAAQLMCLLSTPH